MPLYVNQFFLNRKSFLKVSTSASIISFADNFEGGAETPIGTPWISGPGAYNDMNQTSGGKAEGTGADSAAYVDPALYLFSENHKATVTLDNPSACAPLVRGQPSSSASYIAYVANTTTVLVGKKSAALGFTQIGADVTTSTMTTGDLLTLSATTSGGNCILEVFVNGVSQGSRTDTSSPLTGGQPGMYSNGFTAFLAFSATDI